MPKRDEWPALSRCPACGSNDPRIAATFFGSIGCLDGFHSPRSRKAISDAWSKLRNLGQHEAGAPVETRLTAEQQFRKLAEDVCNRCWHEITPDHEFSVREITDVITAGYEAFRDKSEAQSQQFAAQLESNIRFLNERVAEQKRYIDQCHTAHAGLREEIERLREFLKCDPEETIDDGCGGVWSRTCPECGLGTMHVNRPGKVQCDYCG